MNSPDSSEATIRCSHCGQDNEPRGNFCRECGMQLHPGARPVAAGRTGVDRHVVLCRSLSSRDLDRLWKAYEAVQECDCFRENIQWPDDDEISTELRQVLPEGTLLLSKVWAASRPGEPLRGWLDLVTSLAHSIDAVHRCGCRLNSFGINSIIVAEETHQFAGLCLPVCLTFLDAPRAEMIPAGVDCRYASPEVQGYSEYSIGPAADVYTLAVLTFYLMTGVPPRDLMECNFCPVENSKDLGPYVRECLEDALAIYPARRPYSAGQFVERLRKALVQDLCRLGPAVCIASKTDIGIGGRDTNEDACGVCMRSASDARGRYQFGVAAVADGMGGSAFGERASAFCIERFSKT